MRNLIVTSIALAAFTFVGSTDAEAQSFRSHGGHGYGNSSYGNGYGSSYGNFGNRGFNTYGRNYGVQNYGRSWNGGGHYVPHTTTHFDYHGPSLQPHGNHYDYVPGHYHPHTTTHFDYHRGH
jgi:hypothetical protein